MAETLEAHGRNGQVYFDGKTVTIKREGFGARITQGRGEKSFPVRQLAGVQLKPVAMMTAGFIQFTLPGDISPTTSQKGNRTVDAAADENSVIFLKKQQEEFVALRDAVRTAIADL